MLELILELSAMLVLYVQWHSSVMAIARDESSFSSCSHIPDHEYIFLVITALQYALQRQDSDYAYEK